MKILQLLLIIFLTQIITGCKPIRELSQKVKLNKVFRSHQAKFTPFQSISQSDDFQKLLPIESKYSNFSSLSKITSKSSSWKSTHKNNYMKKPIMLTIMPRNENEYLLMYNINKANITTVNNIKKFNKKSQNTDCIIRFNGYSVDDLYSFIKKSEDDPLIIFAHSIHKGKKIALLNGNRIDTVEIHKKCLDYNKNCLVLTCDGADFNIKGKVTALDALQIWEKSMQKTHAQTTIEDFKELIQYNRELIETKRKVYITFSLSTGGGINYVVFSEYKPFKIKRLRSR